MRFITASMILLFSLNAFSQKKIDQTYDMSVYTTGMTKTGTDYWASGGSDLCIAGNGTNGFVNPSCTGLKKRMVYAEFGKWSSVDYYEDGQLAGQSILPAYISFSMPYKKVLLSMGFVNHYDSKLTFRAERTTLAQPEGTGEYMEVIYRHKYSLLFGSMGYSFNEVISVGTTLSLSILNHNDRIYHGEANGTGQGYSFIVGMTVSPGNDFNLGCVIRYFSDINYEVVLDASGLMMQIDPDVDGNNVNIPADLIDDSFKYHANFPFEVETGFSYKVARRLTLSGKLGIQHWTTKVDQDVDIVNYHCGARFQVSDLVGISLGFFTQKDSGGIQWLYIKRSNQVLTLGAQIRPVQFLNLSMNYIDSKLLAEKGETDNSPRYFSMGIAVQF